MSDSLSAQFTAAVDEMGIDLVGIAPIDRFAELPPERHPASIFPEVTNVIVVAKRIVRGCLRGIEEGTQMMSYQIYALNWLPDRFMAMATVKIASWLEDNRWEAVPLPCLPPEVPAMGVPVREGAPAPNVMLDFADAAVRAGLGEISLAGELMTPEFGHLQRVQIILTNAPLDATPMLTEPVCDRCGKCISACPLGAIDGNATTEIEIAGKKMTVATIDDSICRHCANGAKQNPHYGNGKPDRLAAACMRACVQHAYEADLLTRKFREPFRKRPAWVIDHSGRPRLQENQS